jgi:hypothetical protein
MQKAVGGSAGCAVERPSPSRPTRQDGYDHRANVVWPPGAEPGTPPSPQTQSGEPAAAYQSTPTIRWDDGTVTTRSGQEPWPF